MKTITINTYTAEELKNLFPEAFHKALEQFREDNDQLGEIPWQAETFESLKDCVKMAGLTLRDYSLGICKQSNGITLGFPNGVGDLTGKRAFAWLENNLFSQFRLSWKAKDRWKLAKHNASYRSCHAPGSDVLFSYSPGVVPPCPLTGYCADESYFAKLKKEVREGATLKEAFESLADTYVELLEAEVEQMNSEESFLEASEGKQFTEEGE